MPLLREVVDGVDRVKATQWDRAVQPALDRAEKVAELVATADFVAER